MRAMKCVQGLLVVLSLLLTTQALTAKRPTKKVNVEGWAQVQGKDVAAARNEATRDAQKKAVEMTAGVHIKSMMLDRSYSKLVGDKERFEQEIESKIYSKTDGFVRNFKVLSEKQEGSTFKVKLQIEVDDVELSRQLSILGKHLAGARFPKLMFIVKEEYTGRDSKTSVVPEPTLQSMLEDALLAKGFDLVAQDHIETLRAEEGEVFDDLITDDNKAAKFAMKYGAEYLVRATGRIKYTSYNDLGQKEHHGFTEMSLSAINSSSAAVVASKKASGNSPANCFSEAELKVKAVRHTAPKLIDNLVTRILESWDKETENGIRYSVKLYNVKSYRREGLKFIKLLEKMPDAQQVKKLSFGGGRLEVEVFYPMAHDVSALEGAIIEAIDGEKAFKNLDVTYSRGRELNFKL